MNRQKIIQLLSDYFGNAHYKVTNYLTGEEFFGMRRNRPVKFDYGHHRVLDPDGTFIFDVGDGYIGVSATKPKWRDLRRKYDELGTERPRLFAQFVLEEAAKEFEVEKSFVVSPPR